MSRHLIGLSQARRSRVPRSAAADPDDAPTFEVQIRRRGSFRVCAVFDDRDSALYDAYSTEKRFGRLDVRVVEEQWCPERNIFLCRTVYHGVHDRERQSRLARGGVGPGQSDDAVREPAPQHVWRREQSSSEARHRREDLRRQTRPSRMIAIVLALSSLALGGLYALEALKRIH